MSLLKKKKSSEPYRTKMKKNFFKTLTKLKLKNE